MDSHYINGPSKISQESCNVIFYDVKSRTVTCTYYIFIRGDEQSALVMRLTVFRRGKKMCFQTEVQAL